MDCIRQVAEVFSLSSQLLSSVFFGVFLFSISISLQIFSVDVFFDVIARRNARQDWKVTFASSSCNCVSSTSKSFISPSEPSHLVISRRPLKWTIRMSLIQPRTDLPRSLRSFPGTRTRSLFGNAQRRVAHR